ncbi:hypothetical protein [Epilithonimonas sp.]|uniref:hypothetical protein n=1 Tax=Epilithonimonas sp. TaxID=2894511 RepID=UPI00289794D5|nr:hypothetical protein [Epilithonimonas sp.]
MSDFTFEDKNSLGNSFNNNEKLEMEENISHVWHEVGHIVGNIIAKKLGYDFGGFKEISFLSPESGQSYVKQIELNYFIASERPRGYLDFYGQKNESYFNKEDEEKIKEETKHLKKLLHYFIYLFSGGYFNIFYYKKEENPSEDDFENCYYDSIRDYYGNHFASRAGNDWSKVRELSGYQKLHLGKIIYFRNELFNIFKEIGIFKLLSESIDEIAKEFNGKKMDEKESMLIYEKISVTLESLDMGSLQEIEQLINSTLKDLT